MEKRTLLWLGRIVLSLFSFTALSLFPFLLFGDSNDYKLQREKMVSSQIEGRGIKDEKVLEAMRKVPRHLFVSENLQPFAHRDCPLPIGYGQTISQPYIVALMTELLNLKRGDKVLEIGTGSGYQAAILFQITDKVYTIEIVKELAKPAKERLKNLGYKEIKCKTGDGYYGWKEYAPFKAIIVTAASTIVPPPLLSQLEKGGKLCIPLGNPFTTQNLVLIEKDKEGKIRTRNILPVRFVPLTGKH